MICKWSCEFKLSQFLFDLMVLVLLFDLENKHFKEIDCNQPDYVYCVAAIYTGFNDNQLQ